MMKIGFQKQQKVVAGLDIGTRCVKLVCLDHGAGEYRLHSFGIEELQPDAILAGEVRDREGVIRSVRGLIDQSGVPIKDVVVSLSGNEVLSETLTIGPEFDGKSDEVVRAEAERINPFDFDIGSVTLDYKTLEKEPQADHLKVLRIAAKNEVIYNKYIDVLSGAQVRPAILDVDFCALINVFSHNYDPSAFETVALVNIGVEGTSTVFLGNGVFQIAREVPVGVDAFVKEIQREKRVKIEEAERLLRDTIEDGTEDPELQEMIARVGQDLAKEVDIATSFFRSATVYENLDAIFISGGGAVIPELPDLLAEYTRTPVKILNPLTAIKYDYSLFGDRTVEKISPLLAIALGLALRRKR
jgi:type IV pilus assembly protein PilM